MQLISIIIPFKDASQWISKTIESIQLQSGNWELICVNDHSTDGGEVEILKFQDTRIRVVKNEGTGIISALQTGLKHVNGSYLTRMDADDIMPKGRLLTMAELLSKSPPKTIVTGKVNYFSTGELSVGFANYEIWINERTDNNDFYKHIFRECPVASPNWMGRTEEFKTFDFFSQLKYPEDYDLVFRWLLNQFTIQVVRETTLLWRDHPKRISKNSNAYNQENLFKLKLGWFNFLHPKPKSIALLGAGTKGKIAAKILLKNSRVMNWYDLNYSNFNTPVYNQQINNYNLISEDLLLIAIYPEKREELEAFIRSKGYVLGTNAWYL